MRSDIRHGRFTFNRLGKVWVACKNQDAKRQAEPTEGSDYHATRDNRHPKPLFQNTRTDKRPPPPPPKHGCA